MTDAPPTHSPPPFRAGRRWAMVAAWAVFVMVLLWMPGGEGPAPWAWLERFGDGGGDKLVHAGLFAVQAWLLCRCPPGPGERRWLAACVALAVAFGVVTELGQLAAPGRDASLGDAVADAVGALGAAVVSGRRFRLP